MTVTTATRARRGVLASLLVAGLLVTGNLATTAPDAAHAASYPSWSDVVAARQNEAAKAREVTRIEGLITALELKVQETQEEAMRAGQALADAELAYEQGVERAESLQQQADDAGDRADESQRTAGQMAARLARANGGDITATLFFDGDNATDLLSGLGMATKVAQQADAMYDRAERDRNDAAKLTDQANDARAALKVLAEEAAEALKVAQAASIAAQDALAEQQEFVGTLRAQLAALKADTALTEEQYSEGERIRKAEEARKAEEERKRREEEARNNPPPGGGGNPSGWARPSGGNITSPYGWRVHPINGSWRLHTGTDLGASCNTPIWAASTGTVVYAGWYGTYGNYVRIEHPGGVSTSYAHIVNGGILVGYGQRVSTGQQIARIGTTGDSTGCHLHFEVRVNGNTVNPKDFLNARGIGL